MWAHSAMNAFLICLRFWAACFLLGFFTHEEKSHGVTTRWPRKMSTLLKGMIVSTHHSTTNQCLPWRMDTEVLPFKDSTALTQEEMTIQNALGKVGKRETTQGSVHGKSLSLRWHSSNSLLLVIRNDFNLKSLSYLITTHSWVAFGINTCLKRL